MRPGDLVKLAPDSGIVCLWRSELGPALPNNLHVVDFDHSMVGLVVENVGKPAWAFNAALLTRYLTRKPKENLLVLVNGTYGWQLSGFFERA